MAQLSKFVKGGVATVAGCALAFTGLVLPAQADIVEDGSIITPTEGTTQINLVGFNDFHGRITKVDNFAAQVLQAQQPFGEENTIIVSNGDTIGASEFESSVAGDQPTIDALIELGVEHFTAGNHEFDKGMNWEGELQGYGAQDFDDILDAAGLGGLQVANVRDESGDRVFPGYQTFEVEGQTVAIISAVTASTPSGVSPDGIAGLTFTNPVEEVNDIAADLQDGDDSNGEADILVASYHEGAPTSGTLEENLANETFRSIVEDTDANVDAIFNAHTHQEYIYDAPNGDGTRPVIQSSEYADHVGQIVLDVDAEGNVTGATSSNIPVDHEAEPNIAGLDEASLATYNAVVDVQSAALAEAEELGQVQIGVVEDNISRAYTWAEGSPVSDDRAQESTLGSVVADSMKIWADGNIEGGADLSIMNPGGLRADIDGDGELTYKDAQSVLPFVNNLSVVSITGAELVNVLEEQWQLDADGNVPSRPYLQLGLSSNVNYTYTGEITDDPATTQGEHITSVVIDGEPIVADQVYSVVMPSFLAAGGDNFYSLNNNEGVFDTGSVDLDAFVAYVSSLEGTVLEAEQTRNGFQVEGYFAEDGSAPVVNAGGTLDFTVANVDLRSQDFIANDEIVVTAGDEVIGGGQITGSTSNGDTNSAEVSLEVPANIAPGVYTVTLTAQPSGSSVQVPLEVGQGAPFVTVEHSNYTQAESAAGIDYYGANWAPETGVDVVVTEPSGNTTEITDVVTDENGAFGSQLVYNTYDEATGEVVESNIEFPVGTYTITVSQPIEQAAALADTDEATEVGEALVAEITFTVGEEPTQSPAPSTPGDDDANDDANGAGDDGELAQTGADSNLIFGVLAAAAAALALGATIMMIRRQRNA